MIRWSFEDQEKKWCHSYNEDSGEGCYAWTEDGTPTRSICEACSVQMAFCRGCARYGKCDYWKYPKRFPIVTRFLDRFNVMTATNQPMYPPDWRLWDAREYHMIILASKIKIQIDEAMRPHSGNQP